MFVASKANPAELTAASMLASVEASLRRLRLERLDLFFLHCNLVPDGHPMWQRPEASRFTPVPLFEQQVRPAFERFVREGLVGAWGLRPRLGEKLSS